jgi:DNA-binding CsgD family transcriptional regulator
MDCPLTRRQRQCLLLVMRGLTRQQAARRLGIHHSTVRSHMHGAYSRLGVSCASQAAMVMLRYGWAISSELVPDYTGPSYAAEQPERQLTEGWVPSPGQRLYLDAFDRWLVERDECASARAGGMRHVMFFEREIPSPPRRANDFDGMVRRIAPAICTREQVSVLFREVSRST